MNRTLLLFIVCEKPNRESESSRNYWKALKNVLCPWSSWFIPWVNAGSRNLRSHWADGHGFLGFHVLSQSQRSLGESSSRGPGSCLSLASLPSPFSDKVSFLGSQRRFQPSNTWKSMRWRQTVSEWPGIPFRLMKDNTSWCGFQSMVGTPKKWVVWNRLKSHREHFLWKWIPTAHLSWSSL